MKNASQTRILAVVLAAATLAACVLAGFNVRAENNFVVPTDHVWWVEAPAPTPDNPAAPAGLCARQVPPGSAADVAGVRQGDLLLSVDEHPTHRVVSQLCTGVLRSRHLPDRNLLYPASAAALRRRPLHRPRRYAAIRHQGHPRAHRPYHQRLLPPHRRRLPAHRPLRPLPPLDRPQIHSLLRLLPRLLRPLRLQVHVGSSTPSTGSSTGPTSSRPRFSPRSSCTSPSPSRTSTPSRAIVCAAGSPPRFSTSPASRSSAFRLPPSTSGKPRNSSSIASTRSL